MRTALAADPLDECGASEQVINAIQKHALPPAAPPAGLAGPRVALERGVHPRLASIEHPGLDASAPSSPMNITVRFVEAKQKAPTIDIVPQVVSPEVAKLIVSPEVAKLQERLELARLKTLPFQDSRGLSGRR
jgi:hypothetical protein